MIDWARVHIPFKHSPLNGGEVVSIDEDGEVAWRILKRKQAIGSFDKRISFKSIGGDGQGNATHLWISGNPSKFLQGHNVFGSDDLVSLMFDTFRVICNQFNFQPTLQEYQAIKNGDYELGIVDINYSYELPKRADVQAFIRALEFKAKTRHGRPSMKGGTLYFGKNSERWAIKLYAKGEELSTKTGALPDALKHQGIEDWADNKLRIELRLLSKELAKLGIKHAATLTPELTEKLFKEYLDKINMTDQIKLSNETVNQLPNKLKSTYTLWAQGHDLRSLMSKRTYYYHRKELESYGINIDLAPCSEHQKENNVVPMIRILEATPANIPRWAFTKNLIHSSAQRSA
ncbi:phage/plasmid replication protein, II/X family [Glaciecola sp. 1036]|uniref:phage/plasmid replication protein, II/X family n=1 Tax=Alteromonadaceae TaxID=72275 RepID=UPI003CFF3B41